MIAFIAIIHWSSELDQLCISTRYDEECRFHDLRIIADNDEEQHRLLNTKQALCAPAKSTVDGARGMHNRLNVEVGEIVRSTYGAVVVSGE